MLLDNSSIPYTLFSLCHIHLFQTDVPRHLKTRHIIHYEILNFFTLVLPISIVTHLHEHTNLCSLYIPPLMSTLCDKLKCLNIPYWPAPAPILKPFSPSSPRSSGVNESRQVLQEQPDIAQSLLREPNTPVIRKSRGTSTQVGLQIQQWCSGFEGTNDYLRKQKEMLERYQ